MISPGWAWTSQFLKDSTERAFRAPTRPGLVTAFRDTFYQAFGVFLGQAQATNLGHFTLSRGRWLQRAGRPAQDVSNWPSEEGAC